MLRTDGSASLSKCQYPLGSVQLGGLPAGLLFRPLIQMCGNHAFRELELNERLQSGRSPLKVCQEALRTFAVLLYGAQPLQDHR